MSNLNQYTVDSIVDVLTDYTANGSFEALKLNVKYYNETNYAALVRTTDLEKRKFKPERFTDKKGYDFQKKSALFGGEIVMSNVGSVGNIYKVPHYSMPMTLAPNMFLVKFNESVAVNDYMYYWMTSEDFVNQLFASIGSTTLLAINKGNLRKIKVTLPPVRSQRKIATILRTVDGQIEKTEAIIAKYKAIKQGLMQDLFLRGIDVATGKLRPRYQDAPELYKSSPLGMIPKEWTPCVLEDIFEKLLNGGTPPTNIPHYWQGNIPWVTGADFLESYEIGEIRRYVSPQAARETSTNIIPEGNILLVTRTGVGKLAIAPTDIAISQDITGIILDSGKVSASYFYYHLQVIVEDFKKLNQGTSINGIIRDDLVSYETVYPKEDEQNKVIEILQSNDKLLKKEQDNLSKLNLLKKGLMSDLLSGKVRVQVGEEAMC